MGEVGKTKMKSHSDAAVPECFNNDNTSSGVARNLFRGEQIRGCLGDRS